MFRRLRDDKPIGRKEFIFYFSFFITLNIILMAILPIVSLSIPGSSGNSLFGMIWMIVSFTFFILLFMSVYYIFKVIVLRLKDIGYSTTSFILFTLFSFFAILFMGNGYLEDILVWVFGVYLVYLIYIIFVCIFVTDVN